MISQSLQVHCFNRIETNKGLSKKTVSSSNMKKQDTSTQYNPAIYINERQNITKANDDLERTVKLGALLDFQKNPRTKSNDVSCLENKLDGQLKENSRTRRRNKKIGKSSVLKNPNSKTRKQQHQKLISKMTLPYRVNKNAHGNCSCRDCHTVGALQNIRTHVDTTRFLSNIIAKRGLQKPIFTKNLPPLRDFIGRSVFASPKKSPEFFLSKGKPINLRNEHCDFYSANLSHSKNTKISETGLLNGNSCDLRKFSQTAWRQILTTTASNNFHIKSKDLRANVNHGDSDIVSGVYFENINQATCLYTRFQQRRDVENPGKKSPPSLQESRFINHNVTPHTDEEKWQDSSILERNAVDGLLAIRSPSLWVRTIAPEIPHVEIDAEAKNSLDASIPTAKKRCDKPCAKKPAASGVRKSIRIRPPHHYPLLIGKALEYTGKLPLRKICDRIRRLYPHVYPSDDEQKDSQRVSWRSTIHNVICYSKIFESVSVDEPDIISDDWVGILCAGSKKKLHETALESLVNFTLESEFQQVPAKLQNQENITTNVANGSSEVHKEQASREEAGNAAADDYGGSNYMLPNEVDKNGNFKVWRMRASWLAHCILKGENVLNIEARKAREVFDRIEKQYGLVMGGAPEDFKGDANADDKIPG